MAKAERHLYVPATDLAALAAFAAVSRSGRVAIHPLPAEVTPSLVADMTRKNVHGLLSLALDARGHGLPFVVPGGRFNELYGWDSFFIVWGLTENPENTELARAIVENQAYEIRHYGKILNANRSYYLTRSQPPLFTSSIEKVLARLPNSPERRTWLEPVLRAAISEYENVWTKAPHTLPLCDQGTCLARYFDDAGGEPPEVEPGHFRWFFQQHALEHGHCPRPGQEPAALRAFHACAEELAARYRSGQLADRQIDAFFVNDRCVRESGHDTTYRWFDEGGERCTDFAPVELNALLFKYELDLARLIEEHFAGSFDGRTSAEYCGHARARARLIKKYSYDESGLFFDYDTRKRRRSRYLSATTLVPLWASVSTSCGASLASAETAERLRKAALPLLEAGGGLLATSPSSLSRVKQPKTLVQAENGAFSWVQNDRQWEAPNGWAPHQMLAWAGLSRFGFELDAKRLSYRWLATIVDNAADYHGTVPEKFDVVLRSHRVFAEYGNVNTDFSYISSEGFGWMNASFVVGLGLLGEKERAALSAREPVERVFEAASVPPAR